MSGPTGALDLVGQLVEASNGTFLARDEAGRRWLYKPVAGEAPLRDFPSGTLGRREVAAHLFSAASGFDVVPPTHWVEDAPFGEGSAQEWIEGATTDLVDLVLRDEVDEDWLGLVIGVDQEDRPLALVHADLAALRRLALFDVVANNADRKGAHVLHAPTGGGGDEGADVGEGIVLGVDHGLTFHVHDKLRTVLWGWAGDPLTQAELALVHAAAEATDVLEPWLDPAEVVATRLRADALARAGTFPEPGDRWPVIPWPPL